MTQDKLAVFQASRPMLLGLAYRMLGEAAEAEDVVQDAYLRWENADSVQAPEAWLTRVVADLCLNRLTSARVRREQYIGPWLPEPVVVTEEFGPLETVQQRDSLSFGMMPDTMRFDYFRLLDRIGEGEANPRKSWRHRRSSTTTSSRARTGHQSQV